MSTFLFSVPVSVTGQANAMLFTAIFSLRRVGPRRARARAGSPRQVDSTLRLGPETMWRTQRIYSRLNETGRDGESAASPEWKVGHLDTRTAGQDGIDIVGAGSGKRSRTE